MNSRAKSRQEWDALEKLVARGRKSLRRLSADELAQLDVLYRRTTTHLAQVSSRTADDDLIRYLSELTAAAHSLIYLPPRRKFLVSLFMFISSGFPRSVARTWKYHTLSALLMIAGGIVAYFAVSQDPAAAYALLPAGEFRQPGATREQLLDVLRYGRDEGGGSKFFFASVLFSHNFKVGMLALATGMLAAVPTVMLMVYNGMVLGAFTHIHHDKGIYGEYWAWILPHGVSELWAIILCGGVGMLLGKAIISPGLYTRGESLRRAGREAAMIGAGVAAMLVLSAIAESYIRQSNLSQSARFVFAGMNLLLWASYFAYGAQKERMATLSRPEAR